MSLNENKPGRAKELDLDYIKAEVFGKYTINNRDSSIDIIRTIQDPEKPMTLEDLEVVNEDLISVTCNQHYYYLYFQRTR